MSYSSHAPYAPPESWSAGAPSAPGSSSTRRALPSSPLTPSTSSAAAFSRWSPSSSTALQHDEPAPPTAGRKRSHTTLCEPESDDSGGGERTPAGARAADDDGHSISSYYGSEFDRFREPVADAGGGDDLGGFEGPEADANDELDEERAYRRIEERLKRRRGERAAHADPHNVADGGETLRSSFGSGEYRLTLDGSPTAARVVEAMQVEPASLASSALFRPPSPSPPQPSSATAAAFDPSASRPWAFGSASIGRSSPVVSPAAPPITAPVHAMSSSEPRAYSQHQPWTPAPALPLSMRRRPPLVRNATAAPAPLSPELSRAAAPAESGPSYFHPTPPPTVSNSTAARSRFALPSAGMTQPTPTVEHSPAATTFISRANASLFAPRRPGAMDASGRLRGPSRSANESWLGIRTDSPPPVLSSVEAGATIGLSGGPGSGGRVSPPPSPSGVAGSSTGRSSARAWAPIGTGSSLRGLFSSPPQPSLVLSRPWSGVGPPSDDLQLPPAPASPSTSSATAPNQATGLRPFRLRPRAVAPLLPVTTSPSASARRTSLLAHLGSANDDDETLGGDLGSTGVVRSRFDGAADGFSSTHRRRTHSVADPSTPAEEGAAAGHGTSSSPPPFSSFRPLLLGEGLRNRDAMTPPPAPTLSFLRPLQLPLSANGPNTPAAVAPSAAPRRSRPAPPILTATFGADDDDEDSSGSSSPEFEDSLPLADLSRLNPQTRLPVMLSTGVLSGRGEASTASSTALPPFSSALASDWSSTLASPPAVDSTRPERRTPMLRPLRTTDHGFSARFAAGPPASSAPSTSTESTPPSSFAPFSDSLSPGAAGPTLSSERASMSTASARPGEPSGAGSRLAEYLSRHSERRRRLLPGLFEQSEPVGERPGDEWTGSLLDWFSTRPNSSADPAEIQQTEEQMAARRRRLHELRRSRSSTTQPAPTNGVADQEPSSSLSRTLEALGTRSDAASDDLAPPLPAPLTGGSIWDALLYPSPSSSIPHPSTAAQASPPPPPPLPFSTRYSDSGLPTSPRSREAMLHALLRQISADLSSLSPPEHPASAAAPTTGGPAPSFLSSAGSLRRRDHSSSSFTTTGPMAHHPPPPPIPFGLRNLLTSLSSSAGPGGGLGTDLLTEDEIDLSYEGLLELSARVPAVVRATPDWVVQSLKVGSYRDAALRVGSEVDERCAVCLEDYLPHDLTMTPPCGHFLHKGCLEEWLRTSHVCPLCRADVIPPTDAPRATLAARAGRASPTTGSSMDVGGPYY